MTKKFFAAALLSTAVIGGAAYAQTSQPSTAPAATPSTSAATGTSADQKMALKGNWRASKLMGLDVYNDANEKLGDISELIVDKNGKVQAVVIGVGGFLGIGEHDIAVGMDKLKFMETPARTASTTGTDRPATTGATGSGTTPARDTSSANDWAPDHAVMSGTKEQLKAMPKFSYSDSN
ncbi:PRC-barrel domain-containing protein [Bradyrhizobium sp. LHD-71]|uniref:PRC-barrel domain-containing protein n=1 Tax=Bradyrhizobium sp. LHD-71 TaxID=3072141 RepID=UPI00280E27BC|nr:PRC-barrel domain-containing protein [Bradyrhizobium sp. LHD-71]MDQ8730528.1 PRC-barrel domain-containing protein [Bradyrhizobium sp. LHD-71]